MHPNKTHEEMIASRVAQQQSRSSVLPSSFSRGGGIPVPGTARQQPPSPLATQRVIHIADVPPASSSSSPPPDQDAAMDIGSRRADARLQPGEDEYKEREQEKRTENADSAIPISSDVEWNGRKTSCCARIRIFLAQCVCPSRTMAQLTDCEGPLTRSCLRITRARFVLMVLVCLFATAALTAHSACEARRDALELRRRELNATTPAEDSEKNDLFVDPMQRLMAATLPDRYCSVSDVFAIAGMAMIFCAICAFACFGRIAFAWQKATRSE